MNYDKIGSFIQQRRKAMNLTQKQLADKIGVTDKAISNWERGQGCPDVSILEILSNELGCSILELLKGQKIENKVIPITEADDYIKDSMNVSKESLKIKIRNIVSRVIEFIVILTVGFVLYVNFMQINYIEKKYNYKVTNQDFKTINSIIEKIDHNMNLIEKNVNTFEENDYQDIVSKLNKYYESIKETTLLKRIVAGKDFNYNINDMSLLVVLENDLANELAILDIIQKYTNNENIELYKELITSESLSFSAAYDNVYNKLDNIYKYNLFYDNNDDTLIRNTLFGVKMRVQFELNNLLYLTEVVMEVGDINE